MTRQKRLNAAEEAALTVINQIRADAKAKCDDLERRLNIEQATRTSLSSRCEEYRWEVTSLRSASACLDRAIDVAKANGWNRVQIIAAAKNFEAYLTRERQP